MKKSESANRTKNINRTKNANQTEKIKRKKQNGKNKTEIRTSPDFFNSKKIQTVYSAKPAAPNSESIRLVLKKGYKKT